MLQAVSIVSVNPVAKTLLPTSHQFGAFRFFAFLLSDAFAAVVGKEFRQKNAAPTTATTHSNAAGNERRLYTNISATIPILALPSIGPVR